MIDTKIRIYRNTVILLAALVVAAFFLIQFNIIYGNGAAGVTSGIAPDAGGAANDGAADTGAAGVLPVNSGESDNNAADLFFSDKMSRYTGNSAAQNGIFSDEGARLLNAAGYGSDSDAAGSDAPDDVANGGSGPMEPADAAGNAARTETAPDSLTYVKQFAARTAIYPGGPLSSLSAAAAVGARNGDIQVSSFASSITGALVSADKLLRENDNALLASVSKFDNTPGKPAYLTFDDGPSSMTRQILDILKKRGVRATFFVIGRNIGKYSDIIREMYADGHCIANHSYTHNYTVLYSSASSFRSELKRCDSAINKALGFEYSPGVFRFPGGSTYKLAAKYKSEARNLGYKYYDWNCLNGDAQADLVNKSADGLYDYMVDTFQKQNEVIILMHDSASKQATADMLDRAISYFQNNGYEFKTLDEK